jgi:hypothetical protein
LVVVVLAGEIVVAISASTSLIDPWGDSLSQYGIVR